MLAACIILPLLSHNKKRKRILAVFCERGKFLAREWDMIMKGRQGKTPLTKKDVPMKRVHKAQVLFLENFTVVTLDELGGVIHP